MYINSAYLNNSVIDKMDKSKPLIVTACGTYHLYTHPKLPTWRPKGRVDFQLLYIAAGKAHFHFGDKEEIISAGHMVLYRPKEPQKYEYYAEDQTEVYWVHFTGNNVKNILRSYGMTDEKRIFYCGSGLEYQNHFRTMIQELQMCKDDYQEMLEMHLRQIFIIIHRFLKADNVIGNSYAAEIIDKSRTYFIEHYNEDIQIDDYAASHGMSVSWFIRNFKEYVGETPMKYILSLRIHNAEILLKNPQYNISEISRIIGYENPLYFSRVFKKAKGMSPLEYRKHIDEY